MSIKDQCFKDLAGTIPASVGDKVALLTSSNKTAIYTIMFSYGNDGQRYLSSDKQGRLCFSEAVDSYQNDSIKIYTDYEQATKVMNDLAETSFPNTGILQVCEINLSAIGKPSKG